MLGFKPCKSLGDKAKSNENSGLAPTTFGIGPFLCLLVSLTGHGRMTDSLRISFFSSVKWEFWLQWGCFIFHSEILRWFFRCLTKICPYFLLTLPFYLKKDGLNFLQNGFGWTYRSAGVPTYYTYPPASHPKRSTLNTRIYCSLLYAGREDHRARPCLRQYNILEIMDP